MFTMEKRGLSFWRCRALIARGSASSGVFSIRVPLTLNGILVSLFLTLPKISKRILILTIPVTEKSYYIQKP